MAEERPFTRAQILQRLRRSIAERRPILGAGCSVGIVAKSAEAGGADIIIVYSTGRSRIMGLPTTQLGHSNPITRSMYDEISNVVNRTPIVGGAEATDPTYQKLQRLIDAFRETGFEGLINFPSVGPRPEYAQARAHVGQGLQREFEMVRLARAQDYFTMGYAYHEEQARGLAAAGLDVMVPHSGWTTGGMAGAGESARSLQAACDHTQRLIDITLRENPECICLSHGGPLATPEDTRYLYENTSAQGFVGASSIERIPIEEAVTAAVRAFKDQRLAASAGR